MTSRYKARSSGPLRFHTDRCDVGRRCSACGTARAGRRQHGRRARSRSTTRSSSGGRISARAALPGLLTAPARARRGGEQRAVRAAGLRRARRPLHQPVLAHVRGGGPADARACRALTRGAGRGARPAGGGRRGAVLRDVRSSPGDIQLLNNHVIYHARTRLRGRPGGRPRSPAAAGSGSSMPNGRAPAGLRGAVGAASRPARFAAESRGLSRARRYFTISSSSTSNTSVGSALDHGRPALVASTRCPTGTRAGSCRPRFISDTPSVQQRITPLSGRTMGLAALDGAVEDRAVGESRRDSEPSRVSVAFGEAPVPGLERRDDQPEGGARRAPSRRPPCPGTPARPSSRPTPPRPARPSGAP